MNFRLQNHRYFYRDTISRRLPTKAKELHLPVRLDYTPPDIVPVFQGHEVIIIIIIIITVVVVVAVVVV